MFTNTGFRPYLPFSNLLGPKEGRGPTGTPMSLGPQNPTKQFTYLQARSQGGHDPPMKLTVACAAGHFAPARSATKRKVVQTLAQCPPPVLFNNK